MIVIVIVFRCYGISPKAYKASSCLNNSLKRSTGQEAQELQALSSNYYLGTLFLLTMLLGQAFFMLKLSYIFFGKFIECLS